MKGFTPLYISLHMSVVIKGYICFRNPTGNSESSREGIFKYDMGWQKRGSGRAYDSKSGVGTLIGNTSGKICAFGIRVSDCRTCSNFETEKTPSHKCSKNWSGSAKAMESDVGVDLIKSVEKEGVRVKTLIMDDDTTTMAKVRRELDHTITKWSDVNHTSKHLTNSLFSLQKKHKCLSNIVIAYLKKCFNYALSQTKGNQEQCKLHIQQIVPHSFGEHENCSEWCRHTINPETYEHKTLPKDLTGEVLRSDLEAVFNVFAQNAEKIAPGGSTKDVESFNNMVASKAPKRCHFSASGNLNSRVGCAVAQKNLGNSYINTINERILLSPGIIYSEEATRRDSERKRQKLYTNKRENKLRKLQNKLKKRHVQSAKEKSEGKTYQTAIATITDNENNFIPVHKHPPKSQHVSCSQNLVFCDIETGSLYKDCDILQIAACSDGEHFNQYITPKKLISYAASKVNGLTTQGGVLFLHGSPVLSLPLKASLELFLDWISGIGAVVLVGHNFKVFDFPRLIRAFRITSLETKFHTVCLGGIDTLPIFKSLYPDSENHKQEYLCEKILQQKYSAHNALDDVINLEKLFRCTSVSSDILQKHSFTTNWGFQQHDFQEETARNNETLHILIQNKIVSKQTSYKIASSGLSYRNLQYVCQQDGELGLSHLLGDKSCGETRVTSCKRIIHSIYEYLSSCTSHL